VNYEEAIAFLEDRIRWGMRPGTERVAAIAEALDHPERTYPVIAVTGTNGKFSVATLVTQILSQLGLTVGTYTSPHIESVRERIAIARTPISQEQFASVISYLQPYVELVEAQRGEAVTYFELLTVIALEAFFDAPVHVAVLEAGLGGEYDATNVADASVAVVVGVSLDHVRQFGDDLRRATWEKAGIAKDGSVVITGVDQDDLFEIVRERATEHGAQSIVRLGSDIGLVERRPALGGQLVTIRGLHGVYEDVFLSLLGEHQACNAVLSVAACEAFTAGALDDESVREALGTVRTPGRLEVVARQPLVVLDGGHNPAAAAAVRAGIEETFGYERLIAVVGMLDDKLIEDVIRVWGTAAVDHWIVTAPAAERAASPDRIVDALEAEHVERESIESIPSVAEAIIRAADLASPDDLVLVFGSFYTIGEAVRALRSRGLVPQS
jgi:dihydrofolate synthase/folylpolyglutamate synthase